MFNFYRTIYYHCSASGVNIHNTNQQHGYFYLKFIFKNLIQYRTFIKILRNKNNNINGTT